MAGAGSWRAIGRWRAAQRAGLHDVPVVIVEADDRQALEFAIIENIQRADLNPLDEARGYENLVAQFGYTQNDLAKVMGKSRSHIANTLRLSRLPEPVKEKVAAGALSAGHARALLAVSDPELVAKRIVDQGLTVRDVERIAQRETESPDVPAQRVTAMPTAIRDADTLALERRLSEILGLEVQREHVREHAGQRLDDRVARRDRGRAVRAAAAQHQHLGPRDAGRRAPRARAAPRASPSP